MGGPNAATNATQSMSTVLNETAHANSDPFEDFEEPGENNQTLNPKHYT